jgi:adenosylcobinamide-phosphate synthase
LTASLTVALAFAADRVFGDPARLHPVAGFGRLATALEARWWRPRRRAGVLHTVVLVGGVAIAVRAAASRGRGALDAVVLWATLGGRSLERAALELRAALDAGDERRARSLAPALVGRDPSWLDAAQLARAAVESVAENTSDAVVAPLLWMAALGPAGAAAYRAVNTLDAMVGHRSERCCASAGRRHGSTMPPTGPRRARASSSSSPSRPGGVNRYLHGTEARPRLGDGAPPCAEDIARAVELSRRVAFAAAALAALGARR